MGYKNYNLVGADSKANSGSGAPSLQATTVPSKLFSITVYNNNVGSQFIQLHDASSVPADTSVPELSWAIATQTHLHVEWPLGRQMATGIYVCNSTTDVTKTIGASDCLIDAVYRID